MSCIYPLTDFKGAVSDLGEKLIKARSLKKTNPPNRKWFLNQARRQIRAYLEREGWTK